MKYLSLIAIVALVGLGCNHDRSGEVVWGTSDGEVYPLPGDTLIHISINKGLLVSKISNVNGDTFTLTSKNPIDVYLKRHIPELHDTIYIRDTVYRTKYKRWYPLFDLEDVDTTEWRVDTAHSVSIDTSQMSDWIVVHDVPIDTTPTPKTLQEIFSADTGWISGDTLYIFHAGDSLIKRKIKSSNQ